MAWQPGAPRRAWACAYPQLTILAYFFPPVKRQGVGSGYGRRQEQGRGLPMDGRDCEGVR